MTFQIPEDEESAREDGHFFGRAAGLAASAKMLDEDGRQEQSEVVGAEEVGLVLALADAMAAAGVTRKLMAVWIEAAADAFVAELDTTAACLNAREAFAGRVAISDC